MTPRSAKWPDPDDLDTRGANERLPPDWIATPDMVSQWCSVGTLCARLSDGPDAGTVALWDSTDDLESAGWRLWIPAMGRWIDTSARTVLRMTGGSEAFTRGCEAAFRRRLLDPRLRRSQ